MLLRHTVSALLLLGVLAAVAQGQAPSTAPPLAIFDEATLRQANIDPAAANLLAVLRRRANTDGDPRIIKALIERLGSSQFAQREQASAELIAVGRPALESLRQAARDDADPEIRLRAERCLAAYETLFDPAVSMSVVRRLLYLRAAGAAELLLQLLPDADWEIQDEISHDLQRVALHDGKLDPALLAALEDKTAMRRAAAALTVALVGNDNERLRVRKLLDDRDPEVRLRAAQGLLAVRDGASLPVLIALLDEKNVEISWSAEELLHWVALKSVPKQTVGAASAAERQQAVDAWTAWHKAEAGKIDWQQVEAAPRRPGLYLVCDSGKVWLGGCDGERWILVRFVLPGAFPPSEKTTTEAQLLPGNQILVGYHSDHLEKYSLDGAKLAFPYKGSSRMCQRLPNGNLFVADSFAASEISLDGKLVATVPFQERVSLADAWLTRSGSIISRSESWVIEVDRFSGRVIREGKVEGRFYHHQKFAVRPDGRCVMADMEGNRLLEVDTTGRTLRSFPLLFPYSVEALRNDHYLVSTEGRELRILELDAEGRTVWETFPVKDTYRIRSILDRVRIGFDKPRPPDFNLDSAANRVRGLRDADPLVRRRSAEFLDFLKPTDQASLNAMAAALDDDFGEVRGLVTATLGRIGAPAVPALSRTLTEGSLRSRTAALAALREIGTAANAALPALLPVAMFPQENSVLREQALETLGAIGADSPQVVASLLLIIEDDEQPEPLRCAAARGLGRLAAALKERPEVFDELLGDPDLPHAQAVALLKGLSLGKDGGAALDRLINKGERKFRRQVIQLCDNAEMGEAALPALKHAKKSSDLMISGLATLIIHNIGKRKSTLTPDRTHGGVR